MHNRVRMVVASFLVKDLHVRWQRGAAALHGAGWSTATCRRTSSTGSGSPAPGRDAAPYFRVFNPVTQGEKFDPDGAYVREWVPELRDIPGRAVHEPWKLGLRGARGLPGRRSSTTRAERKVALDDFHRGKG